MEEIVVAAHLCSFGMKKIHANIQVATQSRTILYRMVFGSTWSVVFVFLLIASFSLQSVERAFAAGESESLSTDILERVEASDLTTITDTEIEAAILIGDTNEESVPAELAVQTETDEEQEQQSTLADNETTIVPTQNTELSTADDVLPSDLVNQPSEVALIDVDTTSEPTTTSSTDTTDQNDVPLLGGDDSATAEENAPTTAATTSEMLLPDIVVQSEIPTTTLPVDDRPIMIEDDQVIQFNKSNCLAVEDGSFYCQQSTSTLATNDDGLYSLPDADGDLEIYVKKLGEWIQITSNLTDDASPYYDPLSESFVWHRVIDDRYQIIVYDLETGKETQLTDTTTNNMEPYRADNIVVWQHWENNAWQIMMSDGKTLQQLTNTAEHNLAPVVRNELVVWNRIALNEKTIEVFDTTSGTYMTIRDTDGGTVTNPRMVLVYDAMMDNGDKVTRGYDLVTGEIATFAAEAVPLPEDLPSPDTTGETRALLQSKSSQEEDSEVTISPVPTTGTSTPETVGTSTASNTTVVSNSAGTTELVLDLRSEPVASSTVIVDSAIDIPDLVILPLDDVLSATSSMITE
jgi:hypothetical protein